MAFKISGNFIQTMIDKGLIPEDTISVDFRFNWHDIPVMTIERMPDGEQVEYFIELIGNAEELVPLPPRPKINKSPATEERGI